MSNRQCATVLFCVLCALVDHVFSQLSVQVAGIGNVPVCDQCAQTQAWATLAKIVSANRGWEDAGLMMLDPDGTQMVELSEVSDGLLIPVLRPWSAQLRSWAVLISGHIERFVYKDSGLERLFGSLLREGYVIDVFVALQTGSSNKPFYHGRDPGLPYQLKDNQALVLAAKQFLRDVGAAKVEIELHTHTALKEEQANILKLLRAHSDIDHIDQVLEHELAQYKWQTNGKMFMLRHYAFRMCISNNLKRYTKIAYVREDNHFYQSPPITTVAARLEDTVSPVVLVDKFCSFAGRYSAVNDKTFFANKEGGELLFGNITRLFEVLFFAAYNKRLAQCFRLTGMTGLALANGFEVGSWTQPSLYEEGTVVEEHLSKKIQIEFDVLRSEEFLASYLQQHGAIVFREDLYRVDLRYFWKQRCVPSAYHHCATVPGGGYPKCLGWACPNNHRFCNPWDPHLTRSFVGSCFKMAACVTQLSAWRKNSSKNLPDMPASNPCILLQAAKDLG